MLSKLHWVITWIKSGQTALEKKYCGEIIDDRSFDLACFRLRNETRTRFLRKYVVNPYLKKVDSKILTNCLQAVHVFANVYLSSRLNSLPFEPRGINGCGHFKVLNLS